MLTSLMLFTFFLLPFPLIAIWPKLERRDKHASEPSMRIQLFLYGLAVIPGCFAWAILINLFVDWGEWILWIYPLISILVFIGVRKYALYALHLDAQLATQKRPNIWDQNQSVIPGLSITVMVYILCNVLLFIFFCSATNLGYFSAVVLRSYGKVSLYGLQVIVTALLAIAILLTILYKAKQKRLLSSHLASYISALILLLFFSVFVYKEGNLAKNWRKINGPNYGYYTWHSGMPVNPETAQEYYESALGYSIYTFHGVRHSRIKNEEISPLSPLISYEEPDLQRILKLYNTSLELGFDRRKILRKRAEVNFYLHNHNQAIADIEEYYGGRPMPSKECLIYAWISIAQGKPEEAYKLYQYALFYEDLELESQFLTAKCFLLNGEETKGIQIMKEIIAQDSYSRYSVRYKARKIIEDFEKKTLDHK